MRGKLAVALLLILLATSYACVEVYLHAEDVEVVLGYFCIAVSVVGMVAYLAVTEPPAPPWAGHFPFSRARTATILTSVRNDVHDHDNLQIDYVVGSQVAYLRPTLLLS